MSNKLIITLDSSQIRTYMTCPHLWYLSYKENLRPWNDGLRVNYADPGSLMHKILEIFYTLRALDKAIPRLIHMNLAIEIFKEEKLYETYKVPEKESFYLNRFIDYAIAYATNDINPLVSNGKAAVEVGFTKKLYEDSNVIYLVEGKIDLIGEFNGLEVFADNKTQIRTGNLYEYKPQFLTYAWATELSYGLYNYIGLQKECKPEENLRRKLVYIPKWMVQRWEERMLEVFSAIAISIEFDKPTELSFKRNLNSCSGPDEKRTCTFAMMCNQETESMRLAVKKHYFKTVEAWKPW